ncbi:MAG: hypothetical protein ACE5ID_06110 [Acidobacteriota bacterium]
MPVSAVGPRRHGSWRRGLGLGILLFWPTLPVLASHVRQLNLQEMVKAAGTIFSGRVVAAEPVRMGRLPATRVTFQVEEGLRGVAGRQVVLTFPGGVQENGFPYRIIGLPRFTPGRRLVLLAYPASGLGLTSPVGLYQGFLAVETGAAGLRRIKAAGVRSRLAATAGLQVASRGPSSLSFSYDSFMDRLRRLVQGKAAVPAVPAPAPQKVSP